MLVYQRVSILGTPNYGNPQDGRSGGRSGGRRRELTEPWKVKSGGFFQRDLNIKQMGMGQNTCVA